MPTPPDYSALFTASPYPYLLIDTGLMIIGANPAYLQSTGRSAAELLGQHIFAAFPVNPADPASTNLDEVRHSIELAIASKQPHTSPLLRYAVQRAQLGGTVFEERYWRCVHTPVFDGAGAVWFVAQNAVDVTALVRFDATTGQYHLKQDASALPTVQRMSTPQLHEAMTRILNAERGPLHTMFRQAPGFLAVLAGAEHTFDIANEAYYQLVGQRELLGKPVLAALPELAGQGFDTWLDRAFDSGAPIVMRECKIALQRSAAGPLEARYVDLLLQPIVGEDGRVAGILVQGSDVTDAFLAQRALSEKIRQLEELKANQAFQLEVSDHLRQMVTADDVIGAACELLGRKLAATRVLYAEVDGDSMFIRHDWTADGLGSLAGPSTLATHFAPAISAALRAGQHVVNDDVDRDPRTAAYGGACAAIGVRACLSVPCLKGGRLTAVLTVHSAQPRNWSDQALQLVQESAERTWSALEAAQAQTALRVVRDQSQYIFDSMAEGFALVDPHWTLLHVNAEGQRLTQRTAAEVIGKNHWDIWPELLGTEAERVYRRVMQTGKTEMLEIAHTLPDQRQAWIEIRCHRAPGGGVAFFFRDVTERRTVQEQLAVAERRKDEFLAMLAHELRNPLAPIGAAADLLETATLNAAEIRQTSQIIARQVRHMTSLVDDLLDVSRVTSGLVELHMAPLDLGLIVSEAIEQVGPLIEARRQRLSVELAPQAPLVRGDRKRLVQVLANLLNNAAKYTHEGGHITVRTALRDGEVLLHVIDDGIGMAPDLASRAFDLFTQAERSSDRSLGGLGLGLALVKSIVGLHLGSVSCSSPGPGRGSSFTVRLPPLAGAEAVAPSPPPPDRAAGDQLAAPLRILIVDDNVDAASMLAMLLEASGHQVTVAHDARSALARIGSATHDVFLLDIGLPEIDGNELARRLRAHPASADAVLVAITGYGQARDRAQSAAAGFDHHFVKPVDLAQLQAILSAVPTAGPRY